MKTNNRKILLSIVFLSALFIFFVLFRIYEKSTDSWLDYKIISMIKQSYNFVTTENSEWIYFSQKNSTNKHDNFGTLYRMKSDGTKIEKVLEDVSISGLVIDKDYLYYLDDFRYLIEHNEMDVRKVLEEANGDNVWYLNDEQRLYALSLIDFSTTLVSPNKGIWEYIIVDGWIYFTEASEKEYVSQMSKMRLDGTDYTVLIPITKPHGGCSNLIYKDGYIFFNLYENDNSVYKMSVENDDIELVLKDSGNLYSITDEAILTFNGLDFKIFNLETGSSEDLIKIDLDEYVIDTIKYYNDAIYAIGNKRDQFSTTRELLKITKKGYEVVYDEYWVDQFGIQGDWLFFLVSDNPNNILEKSLYRINLINGEIMKIDLNS
ncbi:hypothetical protein DW1_2303 [Proteiniborus sp. DW1]|uniref:DUF5050 domain-containing protein n=1 Tax=Proteiniborus sp. DW1 TaxID=1889883 RepID=UPI00092E1A25|nr:DUF5050 domain-containing protein [Proteiniborus sp. DW1]SCG83867.1 hypothetical protein DW1_2303 [Proteiniborus sp. DW1]